MNLKDLKTKERPADWPFENATKSSEAEKKKYLADAIEYSRHGSHKPF